jgi:hypothetical protein
MYYNWEIYTDLLPEYRGKDGHGVHSSAPCSHNRWDSDAPCAPCDDLQNRIRAMEVHRCMLDLIYGKRLQLPSLPRSDERLVFLANMIFYADFYNILANASFQIEQAFLEMEDLDGHYHNSPYFFLGVGYHLHSERIFETALQFAVGKGCLDPSQTNLPDDVLEMELGVREGFYHLMNLRSCVPREQRNEL